MKLKLFIFLMLFGAGHTATLTAQTLPSLGAAKSYAILGATSVVNTGLSAITGNVGCSPGTTVTGFLPGIITNGAVITGTAASVVAAKASALDCYNQCNSQTAPASNNLSGKVLGSIFGVTTLTPGVYNFTSGATLNGLLTLNDNGDPNAIFIFKISGSLNVSALARVVMSSGGKGPNVFWQCSSGATVGALASLTGNVVANTSISLGLGSTCTGRLLSLNGGISLETNIAVALLAELLDSDGDGVSNSLDEYPNDATKAYNNYSSSGSGSTLIFEDQWPIMGDFDLNDMVITQKYNVVTNSQNQVVQVIGSFTLIASGGDFENGFGVEFPIQANTVSGLIGGTLEAGQSKAVVILFKNMHTEMATGNTRPGITKSPTKSYTISFDVANGPALSVFGMDYNPFMFTFSGQSRREVHLYGKTPTVLADQTLFGTGNDNTGNGKYYVTKNGLPYAISLPITSFGYPVEGKDISIAYLHFVEWAQSGGVLYADWYSNTAAGYRNNSMVYSQ